MNKRFISISKFGPVYMRVFEYINGSGYEMEIIKEHNYQFYGRLTLNQILNWERYLIDRYGPNVFTTGSKEVINKAMIV